MDSKKIAIFGSTGFIGSNLSRSLLSTDSEIHVFIRISSNIWRLEDIRDSLQIHYYKDILDREVPHRLKEIRPEIVVNAIGAVSDLNESSYQQWKPNFLSLIPLAKAAKFSNVNRLIHLGSSFEYGTASQKYQKLGEEAECNPVSEYGLAKLFQTNYCSYLNRNGVLPVTVLRIFNVFGEYESRERLIPAVTLKALDGQTIELHNPKVERDFIWIKDVISAINRMIDDYGNNSFDGIFNVGTGRSTIVEKVARTLVREAGGRSKILKFGEDARPENYIPGPIADISKMVRVTGWKPKYDVNYALKHTVKWFRKNKGKYKDLYG